MSEATLRLSIFLSVFLVLATAEAVLPYRKLLTPRIKRWPSNIGITLLNSVMLKILFPTSAVAFAALCEDKNWGLFQNFELHPALVLVFSVILLDLAIYAQHVAFHYIPVFWRLHRMHHADTDYDVTTGARFHPIEILLSMLIKLQVIAIIGATAEAVLIFEIILNATAMFNHSNFTLPKRLDQFLRLFLVTPDMHRVHHSVVVDETNSNFGFNLPWWDRIFRTYKVAPRDNPQTMPIGLSEFRSAKDNRLDQMLIQPLK